MTTDALLALRPCEVVPEETVRAWLHAVQLDLDRLDSAVRQAEADADEAERRLGPDDIGTEGEQFEAELRRSLEQLVASTEQDLREVLDEAHRQASVRVSRARAEAETGPEWWPRAVADHTTAPGAAPFLTVVQDPEPIEDRTPYAELREIASRVLEPATDHVLPPIALSAPTPVEVVAPADDDEPDFSLGPDVSDNSPESVHEAFWSEAATVRRVNFGDMWSAAALPMLAAVLLLVALLLLVG